MAPSERKETDSVVETADPKPATPPVSSPAAAAPPTALVLAASPPAKPVPASEAQAARAPALAADTRAAQSAQTPLFNTPLFVVVTSLLVVQLVLLVGNLWFQLHNYRTGITLAQSSGATTDAISLILVYSRAWDFAVTKTSALFLGFLVIYIGALYVLRSADTAYEISYTQGTQMGASLKSSSPGLVMITLGAALVALVLHTKSEVGLQVSAGPPPPEVPAPGPRAAASEAPAARSPAAPARTPAAAPASPPAEDPRTPKLLNP